jgi:hypothetical protein
MDLVTQRLGDLLATPTITQRDGDRALGTVLSDDVFVQFGYDLARCHGGG